MALTIIDKLGQVKGCTVYACKDGIPESVPSTIDAEITLPQIAHPTASIQAMGDMDVPDQTRVNSMSASISCEPSVIQSKLMGYGIQDYVIKWAQEIVRPNGLIDIVPFAAFISGIPSEDVSSTVNVGSDTKGTISIAVTKYRLTQDGKELRYIDKIKGICKIGGVDYRAKINQVL